MGYNFRGFFARCPDGKSAKEIIISASEKWPKTKSKIIEEPFFGIGVSMPDFWNVIEDEEKACRIMCAIEEQLPDFSKKFPEHDFVYVEANCAGGSCLYEGYICKDGKIIFRAESKKSSLARLMAKIKVTLGKGSYFKPFERKFFG